MFCANCGANIPDNSRVCTNCGVPVNQQDGFQPDSFQQPVVGQPAYQQPAPVQPVYQQPTPVQPVYQQPAPSVPGKGMAVTSMVLGIVALALFCIWYLALPCGIVGLALGVVGMNKAKAVGMKSSMAVAGIACSCVALGIMALFVVLVIIGAAELAALGGMF